MLEQPHAPKLRQTPTSTMPFDKQPNGKPITPALSSSFRANTKSPLTPRLVGSVPTSPASSARRDAFVRTRSPARDPVAATSFAGNVTPRTAVRKSRIGTESPATPGSNRSTAPTRPRAISGTKSAITASQLGLGINDSIDRESPSPPSLLESKKSLASVYTVQRKLSGARSAIQAQDENDNKFFRAADVRSYASEKAVVQTDTSPFFFVGSSTENNALSRLSPTRSLQAQADDKFFHANDARPQSASKAPSRPALNHTVSTPNYAGRAHHVETPRPKAVSAQSHSPDKTQSPASQPGSPRKEGARKVLSPANLARQNVDRRGSVSSGLSVGKSDSHLRHKKSMSASSISAAPQRKPSSPGLAALPTLDSRLAGLSNISTQSLDRSTVSAPFSEAFGPSLTQTRVATASPEPLNSNASKSTASTTSDPAALTPSSDTFPDPSQAPPRTPHDAANARRERKVLDLEISNSSLLAINKTLEREMRKQNTELRRFRRLSRSGRLSLAPTNRSMSASTLDTVAEGEDGFDDSEPEEESDLDTIDDDDGDILSNDSSSAHSPGSRTRQRARDERRLMLDLSKHQQMLLDTQKLTQSIRRCLTSTEDLIRDGNKALEYKVGIGDVKLGGRVLTHEEESESSEEESQQRRGLLSPSVTLSQLEEATLWLTSGVGAKDSEEQDLNGTLEQLNTDLDVF